MKECECRTCDDDAFDEQEVLRCFDHSESAVRLPALRFSHTSNVSGSLGEFDPLHEPTARQCLSVKLQTLQDFHNKRAIKGAHLPLRLMLEWLL